MARPARTPRRHPHPTAPQPDGTPVGIRLVKATYQIVLRPAIPPLLDVRFRHDADLKALAELVTAVHGSLWV